MPIAPLKALKSGPCSMNGSMRTNQGVFWHPLPKAGASPCKGTLPIPKMEPLGRALLADS